MNQDLQQRAKAIKLAIFDVDGVLTDGRLYFLTDGSEFKTFNTLDGQGIKMLINSGVRTAIISGRSTPVVEKRANNLGIQHLYQGREDKLVVLDELLGELLSLCLIHIDSVRVARRCGHAPCRPINQCLRIEVAVIINL